MTEGRNHDLRRPDGAPVRVLVVDGPPSESSESSDSTTEPTPNTELMPDGDATPDGEAAPDGEATPRERAPRGDHRGGAGDGDCPEQEAADQDASSS